MVPCGDGLFGFLLSLLPVVLVVPGYEIRSSDFGRTGYERPSDPPAGLLP